MPRTAHSLPITNHVTMIPGNFLTVTYSIMIYFERCSGLPISLSLSISLSFAHSLTHCLSLSPHTHARARARATALYFVSDPTVLPQWQGQLLCPLKVNYATRGYTLDCIYQSDLVALFCILSPRIIVSSQVMAAVSRFNVLCRCVLTEFTSALPKEHWRHNDINRWSRAA